MSKPMSLSKLVADMRSAIRSNKSPRQMAPAFGIPGGIPREFFVIAWQSTPSIDHVVAMTGMRRETAIQRAVTYRARGIHLKKYAVGGPKSVNVKNLNRLAMENMPKSEKGAA